MFNNFYKGIDNQEPKPRKSFLGSWISGRVSIDFGRI